ncbi:MAG: hypothetical protein ACYDBX_02220, partial [Patescibacteria group bacterium]
LSSLVQLPLYREYTTSQGLTYINPTISEQLIAEKHYGRLAFIKGVGNALRLMSINLKNENHPLQISPDIVKALEKDDCELNSIINNLGVRQEKWHTMEMAVRTVLEATPNLGTNMNILDIGLMKILINAGYRLTYDEVKEISRFLVARNKILQRIDEPEDPQDLLRIQGYQQDEETESQRLRHTDPYFIEAMDKSLEGQGSQGPIIDINTMAGWIAVHEIYGPEHQLIRI